MLAFQVGVLIQREHAEHHDDSTSVVFGGSFRSYDLSCVHNYISHLSRNPRNTGNRGRSSAPLGWCLNFMILFLSLSRLTHNSARVLASYPVPIPNSTMLPAALRYWHTSLPNTPAGRRFSWFVLRSVRPKASRVATLSLCMSSSYPTTTASLSSNRLTLSK